MNVVALDLSLTASAMVSVPLDWDGRFDRVHSLVRGEPLRKNATDSERARRTETIARSIVEFVRLRAQRVYIEGYAFSRADKAHSLGELGGVVRLELVRAGIEPVTLSMQTARKLLLGRCPRQGAKVAVAEAFRAAGARFETLDEYDAMAIANLALSDLGGFSFVQEAAA